MYGKVAYDKLQDAYLCEYPIKMDNGSVKICGKWCRDLVRHVTNSHRITSRQYKQLLGIDLTESLMSEATRSKLKKFVISYGNDKNLKAGEKHRFKKGETTIQEYERSEQTKKRLRRLRKDEKDYDPIF
jgi:hypothetical protein